MNEQQWTMRRARKTYRLHRALAGNRPWPWTFRGWARETFKNLELHHMHGKLALIVVRGAS